jgi:hypothetical protein
VAGYVEVVVTVICLGSVYLGNLLAGKGKKEFVKEMQRFVKSVATAQEKKTPSRKRKT